MVGGEAGDRGLGMEVPLLILRQSHQLVVRKVHQLIMVQAHQLIVRETHKFVLGQAAQDIDAAPLHPASRDVLGLDEGGHVCGALLHATPGMGWVLMRMATRLAPCFTLSPGHGGS